MIVSGCVVTPSGYLLGLVGYKASVQLVFRNWQRFVQLMCACVCFFHGMSGRWVREGHWQAWLMMRGPGFGRQPAETMMRAAVGDHVMPGGREFHAALVRAALCDDHLQRRMIGGHVCFPPGPFCLCSAGCRVKREGEHVVYAPKR